MIKNKLPLVSKANDSSINRPLVSVIVVNWNGGIVFKQCLESLKRINYPNWELIVVDNGSTDGTEKKATIINKRNLGFVLANNQGYKVSKGDYVLLLNNDTKVSKDFLTKMVERMEIDSSIGVLQPKIYMMDKLGYLDNAGSFFTKIGFLEHWGFGQKDGQEFANEREVFSAKGACMLAKREVIEKVGLFDSDFVSYFEESDFCWRVWLAGYKVLFYPGAKIYHKVGFTIRRLDVRNINYHYYKNRIASLIKNLGTFDLFTIIPLHILILLGIGFTFLIRGSLQNLLMILNAIFWNLSNFPKILKKRTLIQGQRKISDKELLVKLSAPVDWYKFYGDFKRVEEDIKRKQ